MSHCNAAYMTKTQYRRAQRQYTLSCLKAALQTIGKKTGNGAHMASHTVSTMPKDSPERTSNTIEQVRYVVVEVPKQNEMSTVGKCCKMCGLWEPLVDSYVRRTCSLEAVSDALTSNVAGEQKALSRASLPQEVCESVDGDDFLSLDSASAHDELHPEAMSVKEHEENPAAALEQPPALEEPFHNCVVDVERNSQPRPSTADTGWSSTAAFAGDPGDGDAHEQHICWHELSAPVRATITSLQNVAALKEPLCSSSVVGYFSSHESFLIDCCVATMDEDNLDVRCYCRVVGSSCWILFCSENTSDEPVKFDADIISELKEVMVKNALQTAYDRSI